MDTKSFKPDELAPLHVQLRQWLLDQLATYSLDQKLPTDRHLAAALGISPVTVKRAMSELEREGFVSRQQGRGTFLASRERQVRRPSERAAANGQVILAYPNYFSYEYWVRAHESEALALKNGYSLVEFKINPNTSYAALLELAGQCADLRGIMIAPVPGSIDRDCFERLDALAVPVVVFSHCDFLPLSRHVYSITPDRFKTGYLMMDLLVKAGHESFGWVCSEPQGQDGGQMVRGMKQALKDRDLPVRSLQQLASGARAWESSAEVGYKLCARYLQDTQVTALLVDSINGAFGCQHYLWQCGMSIPQHMSLVNGGIMSPPGPYMSPPITSVNNTFEDEVEAAFRIFLAPAPPPAHELKVSVDVTPGHSIAAPCVSRPAIRTGTPALPAR